MEEIIRFYKQQNEALQAEINALSRRIHLVGTIRLLLVIGAAIAIYLFREQSWTVLTGIALVFIVPFAALMHVHNRLFWKRSYAETKQQLCQSELKGIDYDFSDFDGAADEIDAEHSFSLDLDLFGDRSLFQSMNRTVTLGGRKRLAAWLKSPLDHKDAILRRQTAVRELAAHPERFQHFYALGKMKQGKTEDYRNLARLSEGTAFFLNSNVWRALLWIVPAGWIILIGGNLMGWIAESWIGLYLVVALAIAYARAGQVAKLYAQVDKIDIILSTYSDLLRTLEDEHFEAAELQAIRQKLWNGERKASDSLKTLSRHIGALNQRFSLAGLILNILYLRDTRQAIALEQWKQRHREDTTRWLDALADADAYYSLGNFAFNHPDYTYPVIAEHYFQMQGKELGHPLLRRDVCVKNDVEIPTCPWFLIITGANMAGKSTYLRTVGVNYLLACIGVPVCADSLTVYPAHLVTSLRTSDSLAGNESYFFAELKRLKMIIDRLQSGERLFIILDEILKGTNSADKQRGSLALMKQLVALQSCGIIATHDLVLGTLEGEFPNRIRNYRFEADIHDNELTFSYRLREGVAQNMNACFLMRKMGITV